jgi:hypothetical protein
MIANDSSNAATQLLAGASPWPAETVRTRLELMRGLQASLCAGHRALLALDLPGIERTTMEQAELGRKLAEYIPRCTTSAGNGGNKKRPPAENRAGGFPGCVPELEAELRHAEREVLQALQVQAALLARAQRKLCVIGNMLADRSLNYGPMLGKTAELRSAFGSKTAESI